MGKDNISIKILGVNLLIIVIICFSLIETPLLFAFKFGLKPWQIWGEGFISLLLFTDILLHQKLYTFQKFNQVSKTIYSSWKNPMLYLEIFAALPWGLLVTFFGFPGVVIILKSLRSLRFLRFRKMFTLGDNLTVLPISVKIIGVAIFIIMAIHWIACGWILVNGNLQGNIVDDYNMALYWAVTTLTTVGYGDITPSSNLARLYTMVIMICGVGVYGIVIGNISRLLSTVDRYNEKSREKIQDLNMFMKHYNIPIRLQRAAFNYYNHLYARRLSDNDAKIIADLPLALKVDIQTHMNIKLISEIPLFKNCSHHCLVDIANALEQMSFSPSQYIIQAGDTGEEMYIISHGTVEVIDRENKIIANLQDGKFFGENALLEQTTRNAHVRAHTYCDLYKLSKDNFLEIIKKHPDLLENMERVLKKKYASPKVKKLA